MERWTLTYYNNKIVASQRYQDLFTTINGSLVIRYSNDILDEAREIIRIIENGCSMDIYLHMVERFNLSHEHTSYSGLSCFHLKRRP